MNTPGTIKLTTPVTGTLRISYSRATGAPIEAGRRVNTLPLLKEQEGGTSLFSDATLAQLVESLKSVYRISRDENWLALSEYLSLASQSLPTPSRRVYLFRQENSNHVLSFPNTSVESLGTRPVVALRDPEGFATFLANGGEVRFWHYSNLELPEFSSGIRLTLSTSAPQIIHVRILLEGGFAEALVASPGGGVPFSATVQAIDFLAPNPNTQWMPGDQVETEKGGFGTLSLSLINLARQEQGSPAVLNAEMASGIDFAILRLLGRWGKSPPNLRYSLNGSTVTLRIQDGDGWYWQTLLPNTQGRLEDREFSWAVFTFSPVQENSGIPRGPQTDSNIRKVEFIASAGISVLQVAGAGSMGAPIATPARISAIAIITRHTQASRLRVGDVYLDPDPPLPYRDQVSPFLRIVSGDNAAGWRSNPILGRGTTGHSIWQDSQQHYFEKTGILGPFALAIDWQGRDGDFSDEPHPEVNLRWSGLQAIAGANLAEQWYATKDEQLGIAAMRWLNYVHSNWSAEQTITPPDLLGGEAVSFAPLVIASETLKAAIWCNLAGGDRQISFQVLRYSLDFIQQRRNWFNLSVAPTPELTHQAFAVVMAIALLLKHRPDIRYPRPSDMGDRTSDYATKLLRVRQFEIPLELPKGATHGFRYRLPVARYVNEFKLSIDNFGTLLAIDESGETILLAEH